MDCGRRHARCGAQPPMLTDLAVAAVEGFAAPIQVSATATWDLLGPIAADRARGRSNQTVLLPSAQVTAHAPTQVRARVTTAFTVWTAR